jgi:hypothetical protein
MSFSPGFWSDLLNLPVGREGQTAQNVAEIGVGLHAVAAATLNDRVDNGTAFSSVGVSEKGASSFFREPSVESRSPRDCCRFQSEHPGDKLPAIPIDPRHN